MVETLSPLGGMRSQEAVLATEPEPAHEAHAIIEGIQAIAEENRRASDCVPLPAADRGCDTGDECSDQHGKEGKKRQRSGSLARDIRTLPSLLFQRAHFRYDVVNALLRIGLRYPCACCHELGQIGAIGRCDGRTGEAGRENTRHFASHLRGRSIGVGLSRTKQSVYEVIGLA